MPKLVHITLMTDSYQYKIVITPSNDSLKKNDSSHWNLGGDNSWGKNTAKDTLKVLDNFLTYGISARRKLCLDLDYYPSQRNLLHSSVLY